MALRAPPGDSAVSIWYPSGFRSNRSASMTSFWSSAIRMREEAVTLRLPQCAHWIHACRAPHGQENGGGAHAQQERSPEREGIGRLHVVEQTRRAVVRWEETMPCWERLRATTCASTALDFYSPPRVTIGLTFAARLAGSQIAANAT